MIFYKKLDSAQKHTFNLHLLYSIIEGIIAGFLALSSFVLVKSLKGSDLQIGILVQATTSVLLFSVFANLILKRTNNKKKMLRIVAIVTRLPLLAILFFPRDPQLYTEGNSFAMLFILVFFIFYIANPILFPAISQYLKNSYTHDNLGKLYSYSTTVNKVVIMISTFALGKWLDYDHFALIYAYPLMGILGIISIFILTEIRIEFQQSPPRQKLLKSTIESFKDMYRILKTNKPFLDFEISFMLYGFAWVMTFAIIAIYFEKQLGLDYLSIGFYNTAYNLLAVLLLPITGKLIGKLDLRIYSAITFTSMLLYLLFIWLTEYYNQKFEFLEITFYYTLIIAYFFYGIFASTMALLWYIGSAYFCNKDEVVLYQAAHGELTGIRGTIAPIFGILVYNLFGFEVTFIVAIVLLILSGLVMINSYFKNKRKIIA